MKAWHWALVVVACLLGLLGTVGSGLWVREGDTGSPPRPVFRQRQQDWSWERRDGFVWAEGRVKNISGKTLEAPIEVVIEWETAGGDFIGAGSSLLKSRPLIPGQAVAWTVVTTWDPRMENGQAEVGFRFFGGATIYTAAE